MYVNKLSFENFRNLADGEIHPVEGINVIYGENAQGKTNLLEGIWLFTGGHSFRGSKDSELPRLDLKTGKHEVCTRLKLDFFRKDRDQTAVLNIRNGRRSSVINGVEKKTGSALIGKVCAVIFSPEHLLLVKEGPSRRRSFIDGAICQILPAYAKTLNAYNRSLHQRNALLKDIARHPELIDTLDIWNARLSKFGVQVLTERQIYIEKLKEKIYDIYSGISKNREEMVISYLPSVKTGSGVVKNSLESYMMEELKRMERTDIRTGFTSVGPHRDDLDILIDGMSARVFGSQGQQRSAVLALKLAEAEALADATEDAPLILLDDVMSELDAGRQDYLLNHLHGKQVFITCCDPRAVSLMETGLKFHVIRGKISTEK